MNLTYPIIDRSINDTQRIRSPYEKKVLEVAVFMIPFNVQDQISLYRMLQSRSLRRKKKVNDCVH